MEAVEQNSRTLFRISKLRRLSVTFGLSLLAVFTLSLGTGAVDIPVSQLHAVVIKYLGFEPSAAFSPQQEAVLLHIRLPRLLLAVIVGSGLGISGAVLQGLFRNPLVEPALIGVSSGSALAAVIVIVFSGFFSGAIKEILGVYLLPVLAFCGGLFAALTAYRLSKIDGCSNIALLILIGVAINAMAAALIGLTIYFASESALRDFTFWSMGDLAGATWQKIGISSLFVLVPSAYLLKYHRELNALALGEPEAAYLGIPVEKVKRTMIAAAALIVGASVAITGIISFIGLVIPHMVRTAFGPDHKLVLTGSMLGGAALLILADLAARTLVSPAELPIGIVTALVGAPFFTYLLVKNKKKRAV